jgi:hypothetical protein
MWNRFIISEVILNWNRSQGLIQKKNMIVVLDIIWEDKRSIHWIVCEICSPYVGEIMALQRKEHVRRKICIENTIFEQLNDLKLP